MSSVTGILRALASFSIVSIEGMLSPLSIALIEFLLIFDSEDNFS